MSYILGLDISQWQGTNINFNQVKAAGYQFVIPRMTYAYPGQGTKIDPTASKNYYGALAAGIVTGGYHKVGWTDPIAEADAYLAAMSPLGENDLLAYDIEPNSDVVVPANWSTWEQSFVQRIWDKAHTYPLRYLNISMNNAMPAQGIVTNCASWVAAPSFGWDATLPVNVSVTMQQGATTHVPGISANVADTDAFFGTLDQLKKIAYHEIVTPAPVPQPVPVPPTPVPPVVTPPVVTPDPTPIPPVVVPDPVPPVVIPDPTPVQPTVPIPPQNFIQAFFTAILNFLKTFFGGGKK